MTKQEKVDFVVSTLEELYPNPPIALDHSDPYTLLVAVALSAQTTDKKVNEITPNLLRWQIRQAKWLNFRPNTSRN